MISYVTLCTHPFWSLQEKVILGPNDHFRLKARTSMEDVNLGNGASESFFDLDHLTYPSGQENRVMTRNTSNAVRNRHIPQGEMNLTLKR
jgi:hypothetical protein